MTWRTQVISRRNVLAGIAGTGVMLVGPAILGSRDQARADDDPPSQLARVLLRRADGSVDAGSIVAAGDGEVAVTDGNGDRVLKVSAKRQLTIGRDDDTFWVQAGDDKKRDSLKGPLRVNGTGDGAPLRDVSGNQGNPLAYRGTFEIVPSGGSRVALVNVLGVEEYLYGLVTKELPASFGSDPLKAQAVAARTYTFARRASGMHAAQSADVCDSIHCQAYGGLGSEVGAGRAAVDATRGQVLLRNGDVFEPIYSSACGGHTEAVAQLFGPARSDAGDFDGIADGEMPGGLILTSDDGALTFFKGSWDSNCAGSNRYRWSYTWDEDALADTVTAGLRRFAGTQTVDGSIPDERVKAISEVSVPERGVSGRALSLRFEAPGVSWTVRRDWGIRNFLRTPSGEILPSSAIALDTERSSDGKVTKLTVYGAGYGHGGGMCQWGTRGLAARGQAYDAILAYYFPGADLGRAPRSG